MPSIRPSPPAAAPPPAERRAYRDSRVCVAVLRPSDGLVAAGGLRSAVGAWRAQLRSGDAIATVDADVLIHFAGCLTMDAAAIVRRLQRTAPEARWSAGLASWDHREPLPAVTQRAYDALDRAVREPGSIALASAPGAAAAAEGEGFEPSRPVNPA